MVKEMAAAKKKKNSAKLHRDRSPHARQKDVYVLLMENTVPRFDEAVPQLDEVFTRTYLLIIYLFIWEIENMYCVSIEF